MVEQMAGAIRGMSPAKRITLLTLVVGTAVGLGFLTSWSGGVDMRAVYNGLDAQDAGAIVARLKEQKIPYRISADGRTILVPAESLHEVRMQLASEGLPQGSGVGFEVFDNTKLGMSEFAQNVNYQRALQGELARTIARIGEVESCRVHLVMSEKALFADNEQPASASVAVKLKSGRRLAQDQINGIVHLVSSSVPRLSPDHVTVVDNTGKLLSGARGKNAYGGLSMDQLEYQSTVEKNLEGRVKSMLEQALGDGKAIVRLACDFDFQRHEKTEEHYLPDNRVIRSEQSLNESSRNGEANPQGVPGVRSNTPGPELMQNTPAAGAGAASFEKQDRTVNYEIGKITSRILEPMGKLTRVSVAVMVDGTYRNAPRKGGGTDREYVPRAGRGDSEDREPRQARRELQHGTRGHGRGGQHPLRGLGVDQGRDRRGADRVDHGAGAGDPVHEARGHRALPAVHLLVLRASPRALADRALDRRRRDREAAAQDRRRTGARAGRREEPAVPGPGLHAARQRQRRLAGRDAELD